MGMFHILVADDPPSHQVRKLIDALRERLDFQPVISRKIELKDLSVYDQTRLILITSRAVTKGYELIKTLRLSEFHPLVPIVILSKTGQTPVKVKGIRLEPDAYGLWPQPVGDMVDLAESILESLEYAATYKGLRKKLIFHVQNELRFLFKVNNIISRQFAQIGLEEDEIVNLRLTLDELGTNAIRHGNRNDPKKQVSIRCFIYEKYISLSIEDQGPGFEVSDIPDPTTTERILLPSGRGIFIARQLMDKVKYNEPGNRVEFVKKLSLNPQKSSSAR